MFKSRSDDLEKIIGVAKRYKLQRMKCGDFEFDLSEPDPAKDELVALRNEVEALKLTVSKLKMNQALRTRHFANE